MTADSQPVRGRARQHLFRLVSLGVGFLIPALLIEIVLRLFVPIGGTPRIHEPDPVLGHRQRPNVSVESHVWDARENVTEVRTNEQGLRHNVSIGSRSERYRILLIGDSYTFGYGVSQKDTFGSVLERLLNEGESEGRGVEVINAGVSAYGTAQEWLWLRELLPQLRPDLVVLSIFVGNDVQDNQCLRLIDLGKNDRAPCYSLSRDGELELESEPVLPGPGSASGRRSRIQLNPVAIVKGSRLYNFAYSKARGLLASQPGLVDLLARMGIRLNPGYLPHVVNGWYRGEISTEGWRLTRALLDEFVNETEAHDSELLVMLIPSRIQAIPELKGVADVMYAGEASYAAFGSDPAMPQRLLTEFFESLSVPVVDVLPALQASQDPSSLYYPTIAHWSEAGHELAGRALYERISTMAEVGGDSSKLDESGLEEASRED